MFIFLILLLAFALISAIYVFLISPAYNCDKMPSSLLTSYAHRGFHSEGIPENSMTAFEEACKKGFGIELDIRLTRDGKVVVFHDDTLLRMCGDKVAVSDLSYEELSEYRLSGSEESIPLFSEVLSLVNGRVPILVELKGEDRNGSICDAAIELLDTYDGAFCIESFNPLLIAAIRKKRPSYIRGQLVTKLKKGDVSQPVYVRFLLSHLLLNLLSRPHFIAFDEKKKPTLAIKIASSILGAKKFAWTVRSFDKYTQLKASNTLSIFENFDPSEGVNL